MRSRQRQNVNWDTTGKRENCTHDQFGAVRTPMSKQSIFFSAAIKIYDLSVNYFALWAKEDKRDKRRWLISKLFRLSSNVSFLFCSQIAIDW